jgi:hypothetical protein
MVRFPLKTIGSNTILAKTRENMFKQSIRIQNPAILDKAINEKLKDVCLSCDTFKLTTSVV